MQPCGRLCYVDVVLAGGGGKEGRSLSCLRCVARPLTGFVRRNCIVRDGTYPVRQAPPVLCVRSSSVGSRAATATLRGAVKKDDGAGARLDEVG
ncbi:hypothetical protein MTO96_005598 [Rhipicephalus appendiculatus]